MHSNLGETIQTARKAAHLTQAELGERCGLAAITIRQYENGKREPSIDTLYQIAMALGTTVSELLGEKIITIPLPEYPLQMPSDEEFARLSPVEKEYVVLRLMADTAPDELKKRYDDNYEKANKLGKVELVLRGKELIDLDKYTAPDPHQRIITLKKINVADKPSQHQETPTPSGGESTPEDE